MIAKVTIKMWKSENSLAKTFHVLNNECVVAENIDSPPPFLKIIRLNEHSKREGDLEIQKWNIYEGWEEHSNQKPSVEGVRSFIFRNNMHMSSQSLTTISNNLVWTMILSNPIHNTYLFGCKKFLCNKSPHHFQEIPIINIIFQEIT